MRCLAIGAMSLLVFVSHGAKAQTVPPAPPQVTPAQQVAVLDAAPVQNILRSGTEIPLAIREELTTEKKKLRVGQRFQMEVASAVEMNGVTVIPAGTPATGEITEVRNKGMWGKSGYIGARAVSLRLGDRSVRLTGTFDDKGVTGTAGVVGAVVLIPIAGFFMTGTSAKIPMGSGTKAFLDEDLAFRTVAVQPQVVEVPVAHTAPVAAVQSIAEQAVAPANAASPGK
jgi:hypothetical protein